MNLKKKNVIHTRQCEEDNGSMLISQKIRQYHKLKDNIHFSKVVFECNKKKKQFTLKRFFLIVFLSHIVLPQFISSVRAQC